LTTVRRLDCGGPTRSPWPAVVMSTWINVPRALKHCSDETSVWVKVLPGVPGPGPSFEPTQVGEGATESLGDARRKRAALVPQVLQACWSCCGSSRSPLAAANTRSIPASAASAGLARNLEARVGPYARPESRLVAARALSGTPSSKCPADEAVPRLMGGQEAVGVPQWGRGGYAWWCEVLGTV